MKIVSAKKEKGKPWVLAKIYFLKHCRRLTELKTTETPATAVHRIFLELFRQNPEAIYPNYTKKKVSINSLLSSRWAFVDSEFVVIGEWKKKNEMKCLMFLSYFSDIVIVVVLYFLGQVPKNSVKIKSLNYCVFKILSHVEILFIYFRCRKNNYKAF